MIKETYADIFYLDFVRWVGTTILPEKLESSEFCKEWRITRFYPHHSKPWMVIEFLDGSSLGKTVF